MNSYLAFGNMPLRLWSQLILFRVPSLDVYSCVKHRPIRLGLGIKDWHRSFSQDRCHMHIQWHCQSDHSSIRGQIYYYIADEERGRVSEDLVRPLRAKNDTIV